MKLLHLVHPAKKPVGLFGLWISIHLMLRFILFHRAIFLNMQVFQYISCYGLSQPRCTGGRDRIQFQYISCYGLSKTLWLWYREKHHFNTSHVTVYRKTSVIDAIRYAHFNTSHVTVYLLRSYNRKLSIMISIHLMLRFITLSGYCK